MSSRLPDSHPRNNNRDRSNPRERNSPRDRERPVRRGATATRKSADNRQLPPWLWLVAGIGGGMLITSLLHLSTSSESTEVADEVQTEQVRAEQKPAMAKKPVDKKPIEAAPVAVQRKAETAPTAAVVAEEAEPVTQFDFYTLLPEREVIVPERETTPAERPATAASAASSAAQPATAIPAAASAATGGDSYLLQAGSFRGSADAERRRAQIAALGLQARIETVRAGSDTWFRVHAGPFTSRDQLATARSRLSAQGIETLQIRQK